MKFDFEAARSAGYSDDEIAGYLAKENNFDLGGALKSGYSATDVIGYLSASSEAVERSPKRDLPADIKPSEGRSASPMGQADPRIVQPRDDRGIIQRVGEFLKPEFKSVMEGYQPTPQEKQANVDRRLSYGAGPISQQTEASADLVRAGMANTNDQRVKQVAQEMDRRKQTGFGDLVQAAKNETNIKAARDTKAQEFRSAGELLVDQIVIPAVSGLTSLVQLPTDIIAPSSSLAKSLRETQKELQGQESGVLQAQRDQLRERVKSEDGFFDKYVATVVQLATNPALGLSEAVKQVPMFLGVVGGARIAGGAVGLASNVSPTLALAEALGGNAIRAGATTAGGAAASMVMAGGDAAGGVYEKLTDRNQTPLSVWQQNPDFQQLKSEGKSDKEAIEEISTAKARLAAVVTAPLGLLGFMGAESALASKGLGKATSDALTFSGAGKFIAKDVIGEQLEEGGTQFGGNVVSRTVDPSQKLSEGVPEAMGTALVTTAPYAALGARSQYKEAAEARQRPEDLAGDSIARSLLDVQNYDPALVDPRQTSKFANFTPADSPTKQAGLVDIEVPLPDATAPILPEIDTSTEDEFGLNTLRMGGANVGTGGLPQTEAAGSGNAGSNQLGGGVGLSGSDVDASAGQLGGRAGMPAANAGQDVATGNAGGQQPADLTAKNNNDVVGNLIEPWFGRKGGGYTTQADAEQALPGRQRMFPNLQWRVEEMPNGRFMLGGYEVNTQENGLGTQTTQAQQTETQVAGSAGQGLGQQLATGGGAPQIDGAATGSRDVAAQPANGSGQPRALATREGSQAAGLTAPLRLAPPAPLRVVGQVLTRFKQESGIDVEMGNAPLTESQQVASALARSFGGRVTYLKAEAPGILPNGFVIPQISNKDIFIADDSDDAPMSVVLHEVYHTLPEDKRKALNTQLVALFNESKRGDFARQFQYDANNNELLDEEIPAFMVQAISKRADFWQELRTKMGDGEFAELAKVILDKLSTIISGAKKEYGDDFVDKYISDVEKARDLLSTAYAEAMQAQRESTQEQKLAASNRSRIDLNFKDVIKRTPELQEAAEKVKSGEMTAEEYDRLVNEFKPVEAYKSAPAPATLSEIRSSLTSDKLERIGVPSKVLKAGDPVGLRLDIPAYANHGTWVVSVHEQEAGYSAGKSIGYEPVASATNASFGVVEKAAMNIASGKPKATIAVIKGAWKPTTPAEAKVKADQALKSKDWVQVGMDPERHAYFYDRKNMQPVRSAEEVIQVGPLVLAKNPTYGNKSDFMFSNRVREPEIGAKLRARVEEDFDGAVSEYNKLKGTKGGRVLDTDIARELSPEYRADRSRSMEVHEAASDFIQSNFESRMAEEGEGEIVAFMAGGGGAGKSSAEILLAPILDKATTVLDGTLSSYDKAERNVQMALDSGRKVAILYVYRDPIDALKYGVLTRAMTGGRTVPIDALVKGHAGSSTVVRKLQEKFGDNPNFKLHVVDNSRGRNNAIISDLQSITPVKIDGLKERFINATEQQYQGGAINDVVYQATINKQADAGAEAQGRARVEEVQQGDGVNPTQGGQLVGSGNSLVQQSRRARGEQVGDFNVVTAKDGSLTVYGDSDQIRAAMPEGVVGRVTNDGVVFTNAAAPRVRAALEGRKIAYSRGGAVTDKLPMKDGKYLGAPAKFNTPGKIPQLRKLLRQLADEGAPGRYWYENSSREVLKMVGGDVTEARKFVALLAIYSPQAKVDANSTFALRAWAQYKAGQPISVKTGVMDSKAKNALDRVDEFWSGEKTGNFFFNLLREIDPTTEGKQGATIDMWMMRAGQYDTDAPTATQYSFMENETNRLAAELGWEPQQVQAAIWVAMKARMENSGVKKMTEASSEKKGWIRFDNKVDPETGKKKKVRVILDEKSHRDNWLKHSFEHDVTKDDTQQAKFDFGDGVKRHIGQISFEARPGRSSGVLEGIHTAPYAQQVEFQQAVQRTFYDEQGNDLLAMKLGLLVDTTDILLPGVWQGEVSPSSQKLVAMAPAKGDKGKSNVDPAQAEALNLYAAVAGLVAKQEGVGWHRPFYAGTKRDSNGIDIDLGRAINPAEAKDLEAAVAKWMTDNGKETYVNDKGETKPWNDAFAIISSPNGIRLVNFGIITNDILHSAIVKVAEGALPDFDYRLFASDGEMPTNNWKESPNGESYVQRISAAGRSDLLDWARDLLAPRVQRVFTDFSKRYGWGDAGSIQFSNRASGPAEPAGRSSIGRDQGDGVKVEGAIHYGKQEGLSVLSGSSFGSGIKGAEQARLSEQGADPRIKRRVYFYLPVEGGIAAPEIGLGSSVYTATLSNLYDPSSGSRSFPATPNAFESAVLDAGFRGYINREQGTAVVLNSDVPVKFIGKSFEQTQVTRKIERVVQPVMTRTEGDSLVRKPINEEMAGIIKARPALVRAAPSFKLEFGEARVNAAEAEAADQALADAGASFQFGGVMASNRAKPVYTHVVVDPRNGNKVMGRYQSIQAARRGQDRLDNEYGGYRYQIREIDTNEVRFSNRVSLAEDLAEQEKFLQAKAEQAGYKNIDEFVDNDYDGFVKAAEEWRTENPAEMMMTKRNVSVGNFLLSRDEVGNFKFTAGAKMYRMAADIASAVLAKTPLIGSLKPIDKDLALAMRRMKAEVERAREKTSDVAGKLGKLGEDEREMISDVIEGELKAGIKPPKRVLQLAASMQSIMSEQTAELVRLGMLSSDAASRWDGKYLPRFYEKTLKSEAQQWAKAAKALLGRKKIMQGIGGSSLKGRGKYETVPVDELESWLAQGWEERDPTFDPAVDKEITVWRDYSRAEREKMGEIRDAMFRFVMGYMKSQKDIALGRLFEDLANTVASKKPIDGYVQVPSSNIQDTYTRRYGKLAGKWVPQEVLDHLEAYDTNMDNDLLKIYRKALSMWKEGKTVLNPVAHANNVLGNLTMAHFAGVSYWDVEKYYGAVRDLVKNDKLVKEARDAGLFGGTVSQEELVSMLPDQLKVLAAKTESKAAKGVDALWSALSLFMRKPLGVAYEAEDLFFRYLIYRDARKRGLKPESATTYAQQYIFTYDDLPKGARTIRDAPIGIPFFSWTYKAIPVIARTALEYPWRFAAPAAAMYTANAAMYAIAASMGGGDDDTWYEVFYRYATDPEFRAKAKEMEKQERRYLPEWMKGNSSLGTPKAVRLGTDDLTGLPVFLDTSRIFPGGDLGDFVNNSGGIPLPAWLTPNNPVLTTTTAFLQNKDSFTGKEIVSSKLDTGGEKAAKWGEYAWRQFAPSIAPFNYHFDRTMNALANATDTTIDLGIKEYTGVDKMGQPVQPKYAAMQTFGIKARPTDLEVSEQIEKSQREQAIREFDKQIRTINRLEGKDFYSEEKADKLREAVKEKRQRLKDGLTVTGEEPK